jgi:predicted ferric reductase
MLRDRFIIALAFLGFAGFLGLMVSMALLAASVVSLMLYRWLFVAFALLGVTALAALVLIYVHLRREGR